MIVFVTSAHGQTTKEMKSTMSLGPQNAFYIEIEGANKKMAQNAFEDYVKEFGKLKYNNKAKEHFMMATKIPLINGTSPVDLYANFDDGNNQATAYVWVDLGGAFVNSSAYAKQAESIKVFMFDYFVYVRKIAINEELKAEEKGLGSLEKDFRKLLNKNEDYHKDIEKAKQKIFDAEKDIEKNIIEQDQKNVEIDDQKLKIEKIKDKLNNLGKKG
jgi:hypothetical protein